MALDNHSDSQDTNSTSLVEDSVNISFEDVSYKVRRGFFTRGHKTILNEISGQFNAGELSVIVGQSGAGKSSLMDILAGYTKPTSGRVCVNGRTRNEKMFRRRSCYILQDNQVHDMLTIQESLKIAAELKLGNHVSSEQKNTRVEQIITSLGLSQARNTRAGSLSGGQKKRLVIGLELVSDPSVMVLDEPTSGLDCSISKQLVYLLHMLARQGRTVVISIHQPSALLLHMVDRLYAVVAGRCAYMGSVSQLLPYLERMSLVCPPYHNTIDFFLEVCAENENRLVYSSRNGKSEEWAQNNTNVIDKSFLEYKRSVSEDVRLTSIPAPKDDPTRKILLALKSTYSTSPWKQFIVLIWRELLSIWRNPHFTLVMIAIHLGMAVFVGVIFRNIGVDAAHIQYNYNFLNFTLMFLMFTAFSAVTIRFPEQIPVTRREHFNRWYNTGAYYASTLISALPTQTLCTVLFSLITYLLTGQPLEYLRFFMYCCTLVLVSYVALSIGFFNGSMFNVKNGVIFGPLFIMPFIIFSGFLLKYTDVSAYVQYLFQCSFLKHGLVGLALSIYGLDRAKLICSSKLYCHYRIPLQFLKDNGIIGETFTIAASSLCGIGIIFTMCAYFVLKIRLKNKW